MRQRIRRGTLEHEKAEDGRYYVYVTPREAVENNLENDVGNAALLAHIETLKQELEDWKEEARRKDTIIMSLTQRIPELEPASRPRESPGTASEGEGSTQEPRRSWWRRLFDAS